MTYDDMPVGTVLRNPDDGDTYIRVVGLSGTWLRVQPGGDACEVRGIEMVPFLVELVEKPATPPPLPAKLLDRDGDAWTLQGALYHPFDECAGTCRNGFTRAQLDERYGPLTEVTP